MNSSSLIEYVKNVVNVSSFEPLYLLAATWVDVMPRPAVNFSNDVITAITFTFIYNCACVHVYVRAYVCACACMFDWNLLKILGNSKYKIVHAI